MTGKVRELLQAALQLDPTQRIELADRLLGSVASSELDPEWVRSWSEEAARRAAEIESGQVAAVPWSSLRERFEARLNALQD